MHAAATAPAVEEDVGGLTLDESFEVLERFISVGASDQHVFADPTRENRSEVGLHFLVAAESLASCVSIIAEAFLELGDTGRDRLEVFDGL